MKYLEGLNDRQKEAVLHTDGPLLIIAGAGAGKTKTLVSRIAHLIKNGVQPQKIVAVTFTNKAAKEMKERVYSLLEEDIYLENMGFIGTFHSLGVKILKENHDLIGLSKYFSIADESDALSFIKEAIIKSDLDPKEHEPRKFRSIISKEKGKGNTPKIFEGLVQSHIQEKILSVWREYEALLKKEQSLDFDDLLVKTMNLLKENNELREKYQNRWSHIHIDEYQDTNTVQYTIAKLLTGNTKNICVIGDSDQSIYSWRGADMSNILNFEKEYTDAKTVLLEENYRSTSNILKTANAIIQKNKERKEKNLFTRKQDGESVSIIECYDETREAEAVTKRAGDLLASGVPGSNIAVLYRANFQSRALEEGFLRAQIPYQLLGTKFFDRKEIKDTVSYIRASLNRDSMSDLKRVFGFPSRGIGKTTILKILAGQKESLPQKMKEKIDGVFTTLDHIKQYAENNTPSETIKQTILISGIEHALKNGNDEDKERLENIKELATFALKYDHYQGMEGIEKLLEDVSLESDQDGLMKEDYRASAVRLMTVHASKGLEFDYVFIVGLEQDLFPHERSGERKSTSEKEEERRLFYVAVTRAREKLFLLWTNTRTIFGTRQINTPSEFIYDIPEELIDRDYEGAGTNDRVVYI